MKFPARFAFLFIALILPAFLLAGSPALAQSFPALTGRVVDQAELLDPAQEQALTTKLEALETQSQRQLVVATISDLEGYDIADYGYRLGRKWGIGDKDRNDGALLIIAPNERRMRIEVGFGLEAYLTDALSSQIIRNDITPKFKAGDFPGGIAAGADSIIAQLQLPPDEAAKIAQEAKANAANDNGEGGPSVIFWLFIIFFFVLPTLRSFFSGGKKHLGRRGMAPAIIWGSGVGRGSRWFRRRLWRRCWRRRRQLRRRRRFGRMVT